MSIVVKSILCLWICLSFSGCGLVIGTVVDTTIQAVTYPFKEYIFLGAYKYDNSWKTPYISNDYERDPGEILLGFAVAGGGSRSAYFTACVTEELSKVPVTPGSSRTYIDELDYISSVSGGSLASAYFCMNLYDEKGQRNPDFFNKFKKAMSKNFQIEAFLYYTLGLRLLADIFTYYDRGDLMASIWDHDFFADATFSDLYELEKKGTPTLIINGTEINTGSKFVFSNLSDDHFNRSAYFTSMREAGFINYSATKEYKPFRTIGFQSIGSDIRPYPLSKAIVASASVPNLLGPVTLKDRVCKDRTRLIHIFDGGIYDNYGIESLIQIFTQYLDQHPGAKAKIVVIDGSGYFQEMIHESGKFTVADYSVRLLEITWLRTKAYMEYAFQKARGFQNEKGEYPYRNLEYELVSLYDILPSQVASSPLFPQAAFNQILGPELLSEDFFNKVTAIQTAFAISSRDRKMLDEIAKTVVRKLIYARGKKS